MAFGSLLTKERLRLSDEETVAQITENPYLQFQETLLIDMTRLLTHFTALF